MYGFKHMHSESKNIRRPRPELQYNLAVSETHAIELNGIYWNQLRVDTRNSPLLNMKDFVLKG